MYTHTHLHIYTYIVPTPRIFLKPDYLEQGVVGEPHDLVCLITLSSTVQSNLVNLTWNFTSNDNRVIVIPTTITTDDSIGTIYTTVIQFAYLIEADQGYYTCSMMFNDEDLSNKSFYLKIIGKPVLI